MALEVAITQRRGAFHLDAQFTAPSGVTVLFGPSGSGKTSIAHAIAGLTRPGSGRITLNGDVLFDSHTDTTIPPHRRRVSCIFQDARLFPHLSVQQNLLYGRWFSRPKPPEPPDRIIDMLGLGHLLARRPAGLSGGEKQRVAIGRALLSNPRLIVADEPLAALDDARKAEIIPYFERLRDELGLPILYVSHSIAEVARLATTVIAIEQGRVTRQGTAAEVLADPDFTPSGVRAAGALLSAQIVTHHGDGLTELAAGETPLFIPRPAQYSGTLRLRVAAQDVILSRQRPEGLSALNILPGRVAQIRQGAGPGVLVSLDTPAGTVLARITRRSAQALDLSQGVECFAIVKSVGIAPQDIGGDGPR